MGCGCDTTLARNALISASEVPPNIAGIAAKVAVVLAGPCCATASCRRSQGILCKCLYGLDEFRRYLR